MKALLPVNLTADALHGAAGLDGMDGIDGMDGQDGQAAGPPPGADRIPAPDQLAQWEQESYELDPELALSLGFPLGRGELDAKARIMVFGLSRYSDVSVGDHVHRYGVALRVVLSLVDVSGKVTDPLPTIAAKVQLQQVSATSRMLVSGYVGDISARLPPWQSFDVKTYGEYMKAINGLQGAIFGDEQNVRSTLLSSTLATALKGPASSGSGRHWLHWSS